MLDLDVFGAFDRASKSVIIETLQVLQISERVVNLVSSYLSNFVIWTLVDGQLRGRRIDTGFPQGSIIGPALWTLLSGRFLPSIEAVMKDETGGFILFADDFKICLAGRSILHYEHIINSISSILGHYGLSLNTSKTKFLANHKGQLLLAKNSLTPTMEPHLKLLGLNYRPIWRLGSAMPEFWDQFLDKSRTLALALSPYFKTLHYKCRKITDLILSQCILSTMAHGLPMILDELPVDEVLERLWKN